MYIYRKKYRSKIWNLQRTTKVLKNYRAKIWERKKKKCLVFGVIFPPGPILEEATKKLKNMCRIKCQANKTLSSVVTKKGSPFKPPMPQALIWNPKLLYTLGIGWTRSINRPVFQGTEWTLLDYYLRFRGAKLFCMKMTLLVFQVFVQFFIRDQIYLIQE